MISNLLEIGGLASAAYNYSNGTYEMPEGYSLLSNIYGNDLATDIGGLKDILPFGFIARSTSDESQFVVAIRGTATIWEWIQDARFDKIDCPIESDLGCTEDGFTDVYESLTTGVSMSTGNSEHLSITVRSLCQLFPGAHITITGHSLGGALATLLALELAVDMHYAPSLGTMNVVTFASPRVGDEAFAAKYNAMVPDSLRVVNSVDLVPKLPTWGFTHVNNAYEVNSFTAANLLPSCTHAMNTYLHMISLIDNVPGYPVDPLCSCLIL